MISVLLHIKSYGQFLNNLVNYFDNSIFSQDIPLWNWMTMWSMWSKLITTENSSWSQPIKAAHLHLMGHVLMQASSAGEVLCI